MKRRNLLLSIGAVGASGAAIGTGAFTSVEADRNLSISIAEEDTGLLALSRIEETSEFVSDTGGRNELSFDFNNVTGTNSDGEGIGTESVYQFDRLFEVSNQGAQTVFFQTEFDITSTTGSGVEDGFADQGLYVEESDDHLLDGDRAVAEIKPGKSAKIGFEFDSGGTDAEDPISQINFAAEITASDEAPEGVDTIVESDGTVNEDPPVGQ